VRGQPYAPTSALELLLTFAAIQLAAPGFIAKKGTCSNPRFECCIRKFQTVDGNWHADVAVIGMLTLQRYLSCRSMRVW